MFAPEHSQLETADDIWRQHEPRIRSLYLEQKKTLQQVKNEMETDYNFPSSYSYVFRNLPPNSRRRQQVRLKIGMTVCLNGKFNCAMCSVSGRR